MFIVSVQILICDLNASKYVLTLFNINQRYSGFCFRGTCQLRVVTRHLGCYTMLASLYRIISKKPESSSTPSPQPKISQQAV